MFPVGFSSSGEVYQAGSTLVVHVLMGQNGVATAVAPTGTVTVTFGTMTQTAALTPDSYQNEALSTAFVTLTNVPAGTYQLCASYSGDSNWNATSYVYPETMVYQATTAALTSTTLSLTPSNVNSSGSVTFTASVQATPTSFGAPAGQVLLYANGTLFGSFVVENGSGFTSSASMTVPASEIPYGTLQVVAEYTGGFGMDPSISNAVPLTVTASDFSLIVAGRNLSVASGQSASVPVTLGGPASASITVALSCQPSSAQIGCTVTPNPASLTGSGSASLTINAFTLASAASIPEGPARDRRMGASGEAMAAAFLFLLVLPNRRRSKMPMLLLALIATLGFSIGCGGGGSAAPSSGSQTTPAPAGGYSVVVTGISGGITHNATVTITVQ